jgi:hypothetical protein
MTDQDPSTPSPYEPPTGSSGSGDTGSGGGTPSYEPPSSGSGYQPPAGGGSVYESSSYQPPGGGTPGGQPPGGQPPPGYQGTGPVMPAERNNTQLFGILGIVLGLVCCAPLGILFGWLSMNEAKKTNSDSTLGKVAFWLGIAITALYVVGGVIAVCAGVFSSSNTGY